MRLIFDMKIFLKTILRVLKRDGIVEGNAQKNEVEYNNYINKS